MTDIQNQEKIRITTSQFISIWKGTYPDKEERLPGDIAVYDVDLVSLKRSVRLTNIIIESNQKSKSIKIQNEKGLLPLILNDCTFMNSLEIKGCEVEGDIIFAATHLEESLELTETIINGQLSFDTVHIKDYTIISHLKCGGQFRYSNCVQGMLWFMDSDVGDHCNIIRCDLNGEFRLKNVSINGTFTIVSSSFSDIMEFHHLKTTEGIGIYENRIFKKMVFNGNGDIKGEVFISKSRANSISFEGIQVADILKLEDMKISNQLIFKDSGLKKVRIKGEDSLINEIVFEQRTIQTVDIWNLNRLNRVIFDKSILHKESVIVFNQCKIAQVIFNSFLNLGNLAFVELQPSPQQFLLQDQVKAADRDIITTSSVVSLFSILNSDLGKTQFINCRLNEFKRFEFVSSRIVDSFLAGTKMPESIQVPDTGQLQYDVLVEQRISYAQLRKNAENRGDTIGTLLYFRLELRAYREWLKKNESGNYGERFNLWLNEKSSNYGTDWLRASITGCILLILLFSTYCITYGYRPGTSLRLFLELASYAPEFLNPIRRSEILKDIHFQPATGYPELARIVDYVSRIIIAYFTYQTIQAFRKYGKKG